ncbi:MAG: pro-sigmaK processing inhibitor BofA family protein [Acetatifactor sp.]|nr:pro-sigmaK processing inhibitor BofA family protein [Acetatifactor sp.]
MYKFEWLLNIILRGILGTIAIYFVNKGLDMWGISLGIGVNAVTVLTVAFLGFPGLIGLYGIGLYRML